MRHKIRWTSRKIAARLKVLKPLVYRQHHTIPPFQFLEISSPTAASASTKGDNLPWKEIPPHTYWGNPRTNFILQTNFTVPASWEKDSPVALFLPIGVAGDFSHPEALAYIDGEPFAACDRHHQEIILAEKWRDNKTHTLTLHGWTGIGGSTVGDPTQKLQMRPCQVVQIHQPTREFIALVRVALGIIEHLEEREPAKHHLLNALDAAFKVIDIRNPIGDAFYESIPQAAQALRDGIAKAGPPLDVNITAIGHAHIDVAWLWTLAQTRQKAGRTFHNVLRLMEQFPEFHFTQSQPQLYDYVRQDFPDLFASIQKRIAEGRWEAIGGMWVEADCNLSGPESLARQFLLGRDFFRQNFGEGVESPVLWLPDVFGYAWNLPQLIKEAGMEYFFTIKLGWNQYNRVPYDSFWWQGLDGTRVLTHFSTTKNPDSPHASTYNSDATPSQTLGTWLNFQQKDYAPPGEIPPLLMSYGWGDGGGGPTREMLENIREMRCFPATPQIHTGKVIDFFRELEAVSENLPVWNGELYLEYHRGTYTTQARNKRANRKSEFLLHDAEFLATYASILDIGYSYPHSEFRRAWELVCLNQFHDIIPGSSIRPVYEESLEQYAQVRQSVTEIRDRALSVIAAKLGGDYLIVNPTSFARGEPVSVGVEVADVGELLPYSVIPLTEDRKTKPETPSPVTADRSRLENAYIRVEFDEAGDITRIYDKIAAREVLPQGAVANQFQAFEDCPLSWDAWDIDIFYDDKMWLAEAATSVKVIEAGPLQATLEIQRRILNSSYTQHISLTHNSPRLDFETRVDWQERCILLKTAFPVDVLAPTATYEIQWGNVERPTHRNTSWDWARFETCAQKWVDLSEGNYGVSLLNDCKYGHDIRDNVIRLTLLRGTTSPDPEADLGEHHFTYSLLPHAGSWNERTIAEAYALNDPVIVWARQGGTRDKGLGTREESKSLVPSHSSLVTTNRPNIVIETIKQAEDGHGIIVRMYESQRKRGPFSLTTNFPMSAAWRTNILEENQEEIPVNSTKFQYAITPYQILTFRLMPRK
ncbi:MAG: alpha-mannosidase [Chloroflexota bacterium]|nr:MAG: alpha-mannosidase [Chloroflexota bacterium]